MSARLPRSRPIVSKLVATMDESSIARNRPRPTPILSRKKRNGASSRTSSAPGGTVSFWASASVSIAAGFSDFGDGFGCSWSIVLVTGCRAAATPAGAGIEPAASYSASAAVVEAGPVDIVDFDDPCKDMMCVSTSSRLESSYCFGFFW